MIYIVLADGFEEIEALTPYNLMCRAKLPVINLSDYIQKKKT